MASGWNLWAWLSGGGCGKKWIGVVSGSCCKEVYIDFLILLIPNPLALVLFCSSTYFLLILIFLVLVYFIFVHYSKRCSKNI